MLSPLSENTLAYSKRAKLNNNSTSTPQQQDIIIDNITVDHSPTTLADSPVTTLQRKQVLPRSNYSTFSLQAPSDSTNDTSSHTDEQHRAKIRLLTKKQQSINSEAPNFTNTCTEQSETDGAPSRIFYTS